LQKFIHALAHSGILNNLGQGGEKYAWDLLHTSKYSLSNGIGACFTEFPPRVFIAGTRHYSLTKAVELLGIGKNNVVPIATDKHFRIDIPSLERELKRSIAKIFVPLCVVATAGTTEEGAVDQLDKLLDLRLKLEREHNASFWIHIDAAWGGFFRSLFNMAAEDRATAAILRTSTSFGIPFCADAAEWHLEVLSPFVKELFKNGISTGAAAK